MRLIHRFIWRISVKITQFKIKYISTLSRKNRRFVRAKLGRRNFYYTVYWQRFLIFKGVIIPERRRKWQTIFFSVFGDSLRLLPVYFWRTPLENDKNIRANSCVTRSSLHIQLATTGWFFFLLWAEILFYFDREGPTTTSFDVTHN